MFISFLLMSTACVSEHDSVALMDGEHPFLAYSAFSAIDRHPSINHPCKPNSWHPYYSQITDFQWQTPSVPATHLLFRYQPRESVICCPVGRKYAFEPSSSEGENNCHEMCCELIVSWKTSLWSGHPSGSLRCYNQSTSPCTRNGCPR